ncbi:4'-phosphopantetheinyl transferase superfamily protein [Streptomyces sp. ISL-66]|uniref:4'-phosphopantetheinyl transferase family protein n=1 Tax=Streptomyces sp. ISL-66 TaxID=2819186 RepID=UPI001BE6944B|nr:4'-phosphopantetheinyl transferase superfamily protein [Streptomyces sp. ISL-66]MBT2471039.1 4'-phosphopantetheinyl transferase superfamily protein [Streptomyces sp. ISL-66]
MIKSLSQLGRAAPRTGPLPVGPAVSVWALDTTLDIVGGYRVPDAAAVLDAAEVERAAKLLREADRHRYLTSHLGLRALLGGYLGRDPQAVELTREDCPCCGGPHGRPAVVGGGVHFSLSHSGDLAYFAFARVPVGVDVEAVPGPAATDDVLTSLHAEEIAELRPLSDADRPSALARVWSRKEACLKATGVGIALGLAEPYVGSAPEPAPVPGWILTDLPSPGGYAAALAVRDA